MVTLLDTLLNQGRLDVVFQPIYQVVGESRRAHSWEALTRGPSGTNLENPSVLFEYARRKGHEAELDRLCFAQAFERWRALPALEALAINIHASTLQRDARFPEHIADLAAASSRSLERLTVEIVEHAPAFGGPRFRHALDRLRALGVRIALDDIGLGQSNFRMILDCRPDFFKVDRYLVKGCHADPNRRAVLEGLLHIANSFGSRLIAEGVEVDEELRTVTSLGIDLVQGYLLARPRSVEEVVATLNVPARALRAT